LGCHCRVLSLHIIVIHGLHHVNVFVCQFQFITKLKEFKSIQYWFDMIHHGFHVRIHHVRIYGTFDIQLTHIASFKFSDMPLNLLCLSLQFIGVDTDILGGLVSSTQGC